MTNEEKFEFLNFLKENKAIKAYRNGLLTNLDGINSDVYNKPTLCIEPLKNFTPQGAISSAFYWSKTKEGTTFWRQLNKKWNLHLASLGFVNPFQRQAAKQCSTNL